MKKSMDNVIHCQFFAAGLNLICLHSRDATMVEETKKEKNWVL